MSSRWKLPTMVHDRYLEEVALSRSAEERGDHATAWRHLERAHILGQMAVWPHVGIHARMLRFAVVRWDPSEIIGQLVRIVIAGPGSYTGTVPIGDTGRARSPSPPPPVPDDLRAVLLDGGIELPPAEVA